MRRDGWDEEGWMAEHLDAANYFAILALTSGLSFVRVVEAAWR